MITRKRPLLLAFTLAALLSGVKAQTPAPGPLGKPGAPHTFTIGDSDFLLGGQRLQIRCGEIHAARVPREYWAHRLKMCKAMGLNTVCAYLFWNMHEPREGQFDYDAPISEAGWVTEKFYKTRELLSRYLLPGESLGEIPAANPVAAFAPVAATAAASIFSNLPAPISDDAPRNMEAYDQGYGCILYRTTLPAGPVGQLEVAGIADFGFVSLDEKPAGVFDRRQKESKVRLPARTKPVTLDILVEPMGRINFGPEMNDPKGLRAPVKFAGAELKGWKVFSLPLDSSHSC